MPGCGYLVSQVVKLLPFCVNFVAPPIVRLLRQYWPMQGVE